MLLRVTRPPGLCQPAEDDSRPANKKRKWRIPPACTHYRRTHIWGRCHRGVGINRGDMDATDMLALVPETDRSHLYHQLFATGSGDCDPARTLAGSDAAIASVRFQLASADIVAQLSQCNVTSSSFSGPGTLADLHMGPAANTSLQTRCLTCHGNHTCCPSHYGMIRVPPTVNHMFAGFLASVLNTICIVCHRLLLSASFLELTGRRRADFKSIAKQCARLKFCTRCFSARVLQFRAVTNELKCKPVKGIEPVVSVDGTEGASLPEDGGKLRKTAAGTIASAKLVGGLDGENLGGLVVFYLLMQVPLEDYALLGIDALRNHPASAVFFNYPVPPHSARPSASRPLINNKGNDHGAGADVDNDVDDRVPVDAPPEVSGDADVDETASVGTEAPREEELESVIAPSEICLLDDLADCEEPAAKQQRTGLERPTRQQQRYAKQAAEMAACFQNSRLSRRNRVMITATGFGKILEEDESTVRLRYLVDLCNNARVEPHARTAMAKQYFCGRTIESFTLGQLKQTPGNSSGFQGKPRTIPGMPPPPNQQFLSIRQQLSRKWGLFRRRGLGKRVLCSARSPVSHDPNMPADCVGIPDHIMKTLRVRRIVTKQNRAAILKDLRRGRVHTLTLPHSNAPRDVKPLVRFSLKLRSTDQILRRVYGRHGTTAQAFRRLPAPETTLDLFLEDVLLRDGVQTPVSKFAQFPDLPVGSVVLMEPSAGDRIIINRQPSMYETSAPALRVYRLPPGIHAITMSGSTEEMLKGDCDGDEVNAIVAADEGSKPEIKLISPSSLIASSHACRAGLFPIQDSILTMFLLTHRVPPALPFTVSRGRLHDLLMVIHGSDCMREVASIETQHTTLLHIRKQWAAFSALYPDHPTTCILRENNLSFEQTGLGIVSCMLPLDMNYRGTSKAMVHVSPLIPAAGLPVWVWNGIMVQGVLTNTHLGDSENSMIAHMTSYHGRERACQFVTQVQCTTAALSCILGVTYGLNDCMLPQEVNSRILHDVNTAWDQAIECRINGDRAASLRMLAETRESSVATASQHVFTPRWAHSWCTSQLTKTGTAEASRQALNNVRQKRKRGDRVDTPDTFNQAALIIGSRAKGSMDTFGQVFYPMGQQAFGSADHLEESLWGRCGPFYSGMYRLIALKPDSMNSLCDVFGVKERTSVNPFGVIYGCPGRTATPEVDHIGALMNNTTTPSPLRRAIRGDAYYQSLGERRGTQTKAGDCRVQMRMQGFNGSSGLALGLEPIEYVSCAIAARSTFVQRVKGTSSSGSLLRTCFQMMQDVRAEHNGGIYTPNGMVMPSLTQSGVDPRYLREVTSTSGTSHAKHFTDVHVLAQTLNTQYQNSMC